MSYHMKVANIMNKKGKSGSKGRQTDLSEPSLPNATLPMPIEEVVVDKHALLNLISSRTW